MRVDCDCWLGEWFALPDCVVRVCTSCFSLDDGKMVFSAGCGCLGCIADARAFLTPMLRTHGLGRSEKPLGFVDRLAQHLVNSNFEASRAKR